MKLVLLPVTSMEGHAHVLLQYDFVAKIKDTNQYAMSAWCATVLPTGSVATVCSLLSANEMLRDLVVGSRSPSPPPVDEDMIPGFKQRVRFYSLGEGSDTCICAFLVQHVCSDRLNEAAGGREACRRSRYLLWQSLRDVRERLVAVDRVLKQTGISHVLQLIGEWCEETALSDVAAAAAAVIPDPALKQRIRQLVWDLMEQKQETVFPRPCHGRIPSFKQREVAAENLASLCAFKQARVVKVNPCSAHEHARFLILASQKVLLMPSPDWKAAPFYKIDPKFLSRKQIQRASTQAGAASLGSVLSVNALGNLHVDLMIVGSVAVNPITGARIGEGSGYGDLEYALMSQLGAVSERTIIATIVHESQLVADIPTAAMRPHDLAVSIVATPKRVVFCKNTFQRPTKIDMELIGNDTINKMPALEQYRKLAEAMSQTATSPAVPSSSPPKNNNQVTA